jgi:hypothetical protein
MPQGKTGYRGSFRQSQLSEKLFDSLKELLGSVSGFSVHFLLSISISKLVPRMSRTM